MVIRFFAQHAPSNLVPKASLLFLETRLSWTSQPLLLYSYSRELITQIIFSTGVSPVEYESREAEIWNEVLLSTSLGRKKFGMKCPIWGTGFVFRFSFFIFYWWLNFGKYWDRVIPNQDFFLVQWWPVLFSFSQAYQYMFGVFEIIFRTRVFILVQQVHASAGIFWTRHICFGLQQSRRGLLHLPSADLTFTLFRTCSRFRNLPHRNRAVSRCIFWGARAIFQDSPARVSIVAAIVQSAIWWASLQCSQSGWKPMN